MEQIERNITMKENDAAVDGQISMAGMERWVDITQLAAGLKVPKSFIYRHTMNKGKGCIPRIRVGKHLRFDPEAVKSWILKRNEV
jgi:excisionase family DNA binding protein